MVRVFVRGLLLLALALTGASLPARADDIAKAVSVTPSVLAGGRSLQVGSGIAENTRLTANGSGRGELVFVDGTKLAIGPSSSLNITSSLMSGNTRFKRLGLRASRGAIRWISGSSGSSAYHLSARNATLGIRGTALDITIRGGVTYVALLNGRANVCGRGGCQELKRACDYVEIGRNVSKTQQIAEGFKSKSAAAKVFPYLANPGSLSSRFRVSGSGCLQSFAVILRENKQAPVKVTPAPPPPPPPPPKPRPHHHDHHPHCEGNCGEGRGRGGGNGTGDEGIGNK